MEAELAKKLAAKAARGELDDQYADAQAVAVAAAQRKARLSQPPADEIEKAPDSGVRSSQKALAENVFEDSPHRPLTYSMYTVSELDDVAPRMSMAAISTAPPPPMPSKWSDVWKSGLALLRAWWGCVRAPKPRPRVLDVCRVPASAFYADLRSALCALPWRSIGWVAAVVGGAVFLALLAVVTVAELTDDLKPAQTTTSRAEKKYEAPNAAAEAAAASGMAAVTPPIEIDDDAAHSTPAPAQAKKAAPPPPTPKAAAPAAKPKSKKPKGPDIFIP